MSTRQKITIGVFVFIILIIAWQIYGLFSGPKTTHVPKAPPKGTQTAMTPGMGTQGSVPQPAQFVKQQPVTMTPEYIEMQKLQQQTEAKYVAALNELQMLRIERDIAETNKGIMTAKLDTVTAEKHIVDLLRPPPPTTASYAKTLVTGEAQLTPPAAIPAPTAEAAYTVISVSQLKNRWSAVLGYQGSLYNVAVGDILPPDGSVVLTINRSGVLLEKGGVKRKISLVPII